MFADDAHQHEATTNAESSGATTRGNGETHHGHTGHGHGSENPLDVFMKKTTKALGETFTRAIKNPLKTSAFTGTGIIGAGGMLSLFSVPAGYAVAAVGGLILAPAAIVGGIASLIRVIPWFLDKIHAVAQKFGGGGGGHSAPAAPKGGGDHGGGHGH